MIDDDDAPDLTEVLRAAMRELAANIHVMMPAKVERYYPEDGTVDAQPLIRDWLTRWSDYCSGPVHTRVPIAFMRWGGFVFRAEPKPGDIVTLMYCDRALDNWVAGEEPTKEADPKRGRRHDLTDPIAIVGPSIYDQPAPGLGDGELVLGREDGAGELRVKQDGSIQLGPHQGAHQAVARVKDEAESSSKTDPDFWKWTAAVHAALSALAGPSAPAGTAYKAAASTPPAKLTSAITSGSKHVSSS